MCTIMHFKQLCGISARSSFHLLQRTASSVAGSSPTKSTLQYERDPQPLFTDAETQQLLQSMTQMQLSKVFQKSTVSDNSIEYKFMTNEELEKEFVKTIERARKKLQMPPVIKVRQDKQQIISRDAALKGYSDTKYVFTDITYGLRQSDRKVVVRQTDGTLEYAPMEVAKRMAQLYFPLPGRKIRVPKIFEEEHLQRCLDEHKYKFVMDRMIVQYEPYEEEFHSISSRVYEHINESKEFDTLRSTRHFGPMAFFYAWHRCIDDLLYDMVRRDYLRNGAELIALLYKIHALEAVPKELFSQLDALKPKEEPVLEELRKTLNKSKKDMQEEIKTAIGKSREDFTIDELCLKFIEDYINKHALKKVQLELAVQTLKEINAEKKQLFDGLNKAHGVQ